MNERCAIETCDGEEDAEPRFGRIFLLVDDRTVRVPLCADHYDAIVEANSKRNAWLADADRSVPVAGAR